ncbi:pseudouridine synthase [Arthrobacter sp. GCM10027362]|uniref:pseudouridine synthase n=1 Tax=Arthrobacter sp. GCM10027362 TaxID=3273379 RepID=UPI00363B40E9
MTHAPRSGSGRNTPRGGNGPRKSGKAFGAPAGGRTGGKTGGQAGGRTGGKDQNFKDQGFKAGQGQPGRAGASKSGASKSGAKPGKGRPPKPAGPRAFGQERFGQNLGPVRNRPRPVPTGHGETSDLHHPEGVRLQKVMASAGVASRRVCEEMIEAGRVEVDGVVVRELGVRVDPARAAIYVDGMRIQTDETLKYFVFNKPKGVVSTMEDPEGRPCIGDYLKKHQGERLFHVGRLDQATEGLLLLTNDGELANRLTHPSYEVPKTYLVQVRGPMEQGIGARMKQGIELEDGIATVDSFKLRDSVPGHVLVEVVLHSGKNRIVRRMFEAVGYPVERLVRTQIGPIGLGNQRQGSIRALGRHEVGHLLALVGM